MRFTTIIVSRDGVVYDIGKTRKEKIVVEGKDGKLKEATLIRPTEYPPTLICPKGGYIQNPQDIPAFSMCVSEELCAELKKMKKKEIKKFFGLRT